MPPILILSSILRAPLFHHHPATCSPSHLTASATPTHQEALLDLEVPISSQVRMSFQTSWNRWSRFLPGPGVRCQFCVLPAGCSYRLNCWTGCIWNVISYDCFLVLSPSPSDGCSRKKSCSHPTPRSAWMRFCDYCKGRAEEKSRCAGPHSA